MSASTSALSSSSSTSSSALNSSSSSSSRSSTGSSASSQKPSSFRPPSQFRSKATPHSSASPPAVKKGSLNNKLIGSICVLAAAVFVVIAFLTLASAIFAASSGAGPAAVAVGVIGVTIFAGLTIASASMAIHYFKKV